MDLSTVILSGELGQHNRRSLRNRVIRPPCITPLYRVGVIPVHREIPHDHEFPVVGHPRYTPPLKGWRGSDDPSPHPPTERNIMTTTALAAIERRYLDPTTAASYLNLSVATLANWRSAGTGPAFLKVGGRIRYRLAALDAFVEGR